MSITVTISGPVGSGKSYIYGEIEIALRALGIPVSHADPRAAAFERSGVGAAGEDYRDLYQPSVTLVEKVTGQ